MNTTHLKRNISCMGIVIAKNAGKPAVLMMKNGSEWVFPKGHVEKGETFTETACREVLEETGVALSTKNCRGQIDYFEFDFAGKTRKKCIQVYLFEVEILQPTIPNTDEGISIAVWIPVSEALNILSHTDSKHALKKALKTLNIINQKPNEKYR